MRVEVFPVVVGNIAVTKGLSFTMLVASVLLLGGMVGSKLSTY